MVKTKENIVNNVFSLRRLLLFMRLELVTNYKIISVFTATCASVLFLYCLAFPVRTVTENFHPVVCALLLFVGGFWISSLSFKDVHDEKKNHGFFTLPVSNLEKFLGKLLLTSIGYVIALSLCYVVLSVVVLGINLLLFKYPQPVFNPFDVGVIDYLRWYLVWQSMFLLGSIYFAKSALSKIVLTISLVLIVLVIFAFVFSALFVGSQATFTLTWNDPVIRIIKVVFGVLIAPFCWLVTYLRLTEAEL